MGLAKVLLGRGSKETGLAKFTRIDSLGLARRRLAAKAAQDEELHADNADLGGTGVVSRDGEGGEENLVEDFQDEPDARTLSRQHRDSLRSHRRRFRERASLDWPSSHEKNTLDGKGVSWSNGVRPFFPVTANGEDDYAGKYQADMVGAAEQDGRGSCPNNTSRHVRFRRASDGEYLASTRMHKAHEGGIPQAFKAVQQKAERLFRRLTANFVTESHSSRPRSATPSRGGSPTRPQGHPASRATSATRSASSMGFILRYRSVDASSGGGSGGDADGDGDLFPAAVARAIAVATASTGEEHSYSTTAAAAAAVARRRRSKRQSAPGELLFTSIVGSASAVRDSASQALGAGVGRLRARSVSKEDGLGAALCAATGGVSQGSGHIGGRSRNWLMRLSRGLTGGSGTYKVMAAGGGGGSGTGLAVTPSLATPPSSPPSGITTEDAEAAKEQRRQSLEVNSRNGSGGGGGGGTRGSPAEAATQSGGS